MSILLCSASGERVRENRTLRGHHSTLPKQKKKRYPLKRKESALLIGERNRDSTRKNRRGGKDSTYRSDESECAQSGRPRHRRGRARFSTILSRETRTRNGSISREPPADSFLARQSTPIPRAASAMACLDGAFNKRSERQRDLTPNISREALVCAHAVLASRVASSVNAKFENPSLLDLSHHFP